NGTLTVSSTGSITQAANTTITATGNASFNAVNGAVNLNAATNVFNGSVALVDSGANDITLSTNSALLLAGINVSGGNLSVTTNAAGNISQVANTAVVVGGTAAFNAANGAIVLGNAGDSFNGAVSLITNAPANAVLANNKALALGNISVNSG